MLLESELITAEQLAAAIEQQKRTDRRIGQVLIDMGATTADAVLGALSVQLGIPGMRVNAYTVDQEALRVLPEKVARRHAAFPLSRVGASLTVALASPPNLETLDDLRFASGCIANVTASRISKDRVRKIRIFQRDSYLSIDYAAQEVERWRLLKQDGVRPVIDGGKLEVAQEEPLKRELADFVAAVRERRSPAVSGAEFEDIGVGELLHTAHDLERFDRRVVGEVEQAILVVHVGVDAVGDRHERAPAVRVERAAHEAQQRQQQVCWLNRLVVVLLHQALRSQNSFL